MAQEKASVRARVQKFGSYLSSMVMPNIGAFIAWGLITALFIPDGWFPNETIAQIVSPSITYLLPLLIGFTGGRLVHDFRGGVVGAIVTMGAIVGSPDTPMFLGAMAMGPLGGYAIKLFDQYVGSKVRSGFEMLVNNFSAGIIGGALAIGAIYFVGPLLEGLTNVLASGVDWLVGLGLLPLVNVLIEPAKVLFLNNAINHSVFTPLGIEQSAEVGKSILFLLEANPGPGLGILLAFMFFGTGSARASSPGAAIIHFFGGIHEIYFPYILMKPFLIVAAIGGGVTGTLLFSLLDVGLRSPASPGSVIAIFLMGNPSDYLGLAIGIIGATAVSFAISAVVLKRSPIAADTNIEEATAKSKEMKGTKPAAAVGINQSAGATDEAVEANAEHVDTSSDSFDYSNVNKITFACDAGMGSSAMGASLLRKKMKDAGLTEIKVDNAAISNIQNDADIVITQKNLTDRARNKRPDAEHISVENFLNSPRYAELIENLKKHQ
ncbi:PTS mannitol transporter subunit IICB [Terribacillus saccharophilus]|uniref:PTS mannitol transporter subunit IICB n=1 Tax=Terribacillus saccharophilus TaxID=361277 RepID=UPI00298A0762|nr:PTS mannitol transporter subunit IICB [Terribacillus saccharophilus]MCM3225482.1 PTS mannitol transporter subunit IICB [Terribacillus saccharophilus]